MSPTKTTPLIGITSGDPAGIGPEIVSKLFARNRPARSCALVLGARRVFDVRGGGGFLQQVHVHAVDDIRDVRARRGHIYLLETGCRSSWPRGRDSRSGGRHAGVAIEMACRLARDGTIGGIVTAPISKKSLNLAGYRFTGHTEMLARYLDAPDCQMMMAWRDFRVVPLTRHIPLNRVSRAVTGERILTALAVIDRALREQFGVKRPRIAVSGLNPHAGEAGTLGMEEQKTIIPALTRARRRGMRVTGPVPADALFQAARDGTFDAFLTMYHDQGLIPFKMLAKRRGVNVTIGLPVVRTSVDHGVAYDIVGKGIAGTDSLKAAYRLAEKLVLG